MHIISNQYTQTSDLLYVRGKNTNASVRKEIHFQYMNGFSGIIASIRHVSALRLMPNYVIRFLLSLQPYPV